MKDVAAKVVLVIYFLVEEFYNHGGRLRYNHTLYLLLWIGILWKVKGVAATIICVYIVIGLGIL